MLPSPGQCKFIEEQVPGLPQAPPKPAEIVPVNNSSWKGMGQVQRLVFGVYFPAGMLERCQVKQVLLTLTWHVLGHTYCRIREEESESAQAGMRALKHTQR